MEKVCWYVLTLLLWHLDLSLLSPLPLLPQAELLQFAKHHGILTVVTASWHSLVFQMLKDYSLSCPI